MEGIIALILLTSIHVTVIEGPEYKGHAAIIQGHNIELVHGWQTTEKAAIRNDAIWAVNAGAGVGNVVVGGELLSDFESSTDRMIFTRDGVFIGFDEKGDLIGEEVYNECDLWAMDPEHGVTFGPQLIRDGRMIKLDNQDKHPRTAVGQDRFGRIIFITIDGRQKGWSEGVTLQMLAVIMLGKDVVNAYNLDGGGSSAMFHEGGIINRPTDRSRKVPSHFIIKEVK